MFLQSANNIAEIVVSVSLQITVMIVMFLSTAFAMPHTAVFHEI